jgi:hypothetical protein
MKTISGEILAHKLAEYGWHQAISEGNHHILICAGESAKLSIPFFDGQTLKKELFDFFLKQTFLREEDL